MFFQIPIKIPHNKEWEDKVDELFFSDSETKNDNM